MTKTDTGIIPQEIDEDELSDEQLQMLGVEEYPQEPEWVSTPTGNPFDEGFLRIWMNRLETANRQANPNNPSDIFGQRTLRTREFGSEYAPLGRQEAAIVYDDVAQWGPATATGTSAAQRAPELEVDAPNYDNLQDMIRMLQESQESDES